MSAEISRREARRAAVFLLYQWDVTGTPLGSLHEGEVDEYTRQVTDAVAAHAPELDARITAASDEWTADRLGAWLDEGHDVYAYFNNDREGFAVRNALRLKERLGV